MKKRLLSGILAGLMLLALVPVQALAAISDNSVLLPVVKEGEEAGYSGSEISLLDLEGDPTRYVYTYEGAEDFSLYYLYLLQDGEYMTVKPEEESVLQVLDGDGEILASSESVSYYYEDHDTGYYYASYVSFEDTALAAGTYTLRLAMSGDSGATYDVDKKLFVVGEDDMLLQGVTIQELTAGAEEFEIFLTLCGLEKESDLDGFSAELLDSEGEVVAASSGQYRELSFYRYAQRWYFFAQMLVKDGCEMKEDEEYSLLLTFESDKTLYNAAGTAIRTASAPSLSIASAEVTDAQTAKLEVTLADYDADTKYCIAATEKQSTYFPDSGNGTVYASWEGKGSDLTDGTVTLSLTQNGVSMPMSSYPETFYVSVYEWRTYSGGYYYYREYLNFQNLYTVSGQNASYIFQPSSISTKASSVSFCLTCYNSTLYRGSGDVLTLLDRKGNEVGRCTQITQLDSSNNTVILTGTLNITGTLSMGLYTVLLNDTEIDTSYGHVGTSTAVYLPTVDWSARTFWTALDKFPIDLDVVNSSGSGRVEFREGSDTGAVKLSYPVTGSKPEYGDGYTYTYLVQIPAATVTSSLTDGGSYEMVFVDDNDDNDECGLGRGAMTFTTEKVDFDPSNNRHVYLYTYDLEPGDQTLRAQIYITKCKNVSEAEVTATLKGLTLTTVSGKNVTVTDVSYDQTTDIGSPEALLSLSEAVTAGTWSVQYEGEEIRSFTISEPVADKDKIPYLYGSASLVGSTWQFFGQWLPTDSTYTAKIYQGYSCLSEQALALTLKGACDGDTQYLCLDASAVTLDPGTYQVRVYWDGKLLGEADLVMTDSTQVSILPYDDYYGYYSDDGVANRIITNKYGEVSFRVSGGSYTQLRASEDKETLKDAYYDRISDSYLELSEGNGEKTIYVQLKDAVSGTESEVYTVTVWRQEGEMTLLTDEVPVGICADKTVTLTVATQCPYTNAFVRFIKADGSTETEQMIYQGTGTYNGSTESYALFSFTVDTSAWSFSYYYEDTEQVKFFLAADEYENEANYYAQSEEQLLIFGSPDHVILPQFDKNGELWSKTGDVELRGYAEPNSGVTLQLKPATGTTQILYAQTGSYGAFKVSTTDMKITTLADGRYTVTAKSEEDLTQDGTLTLVVDTTAPKITGVGFVFNTNGTATLRWLCEEENLDLSGCKVYQNDKLLSGGNITYVDGYYTRTVTAQQDDDNVFTIEMVDYAGNISRVTANTKDNEPPTAPTAAPTLEGRTTTTLTIRWTAGTDNMGVAGYDIYDGEEHLTRTVNGQGTDDLSCTLTGLEPGKEYQLNVKTRDKAGNLSETTSPVLTASTVDLLVTDSSLKAVYVVDGYIGKTIPVSAKVTANEADYSVVLKEAQLQYRLSGVESAQWVTVDLTVSNDPTAFSGTWSVAGTDVDGYLPMGNYEVRFLVTDSEGGTAYSRPSNIVLLKFDDEPPTVPGTPESDEHTTVSITFHWTASTDDGRVDHYEIWRDGVKVGTSETTSFTDTGLTQDTAYAYQVLAVDGRENRSGLSEQAELKTAALSFASATTFDASYTMEEQIGTHISVSAVFQPEEGYETSVSMALEYKLESAAEWSSVSLSVDKNDENAFSGYWEMKEDGSWLTEGDYQVRFAVTDGYATAYSDVQTVSLLRDKTAPTVSVTTPVNGLVIGGKAVQINYKAEDNVGVSEFLLSYSTDGEQFTQVYSKKPETVLKTNWLNYTWDPSALPSGSYTLRLAAKDEVGNVGYQDVSVTLDTTPPDPVTALTVTGTSRYISVMWQYEGTVEQDLHFRLYRAESEDGPYTQIADQRAIGYYDDGKTAQAGKTYWYKVTTLDDFDNESEASSVVSATLVADTESPTIGEMLPADGSTLRRSTALRVTAADNYRLAKAVFEYRSEGGDWVTIGTRSVDAQTPTNNATFSQTWDLSGLTAGKYEVRVSVYDDSVNDVSAGDGYTANDPAVITRTFTVKPYNKPVAPVVTKAASGFKSVELTWSYSGDTDTLSRFILYTATAESGPYTAARAVNASTRSCELSLPEVGTTYYYKVQAVDTYGATADSTVGSVLSQGTDTEKPVAVILPEALQAAEGTAFQFSAANSTDNDAITSYRWDFGDGGSSTEKCPEHTYSKAGTYTVKLTVTDASGNQDTVSADMTVVDITSEDAEYTLVTFHVVDAGKDGTPAVSGADLNIFFSDQPTAAVQSGSDGCATVLLRRGQNVVSVAANGFVPVSKTVNVTEGTDGRMEATIGLSTASLVRGELTATEMTYNEIVSAGIDVDDPDNQHVWKFATELTFHVGLKTYSIPIVAGYKNSAGRFFNGAGAWFTCGGGGDGGAFGPGSGTFNIGVFPMLTEGFYLVIYGEAHWLKEMYHVELLMMNDSLTDDIRDCEAVLELPDGLSLAAMLSGSQQESIEIGTIGKGGESAANWYVCGDKAGEYYLTASVTGQLVNGAVSEPFAETFTTSEPVKVYAGSALKMTVTVDDVAERGKDYKVKFHLENVSDKSLYNLSFAITGIEQGKILSLVEGDEITSEKLPIESQSFDDFCYDVKELAPGGYIEIDVSTTIWFNSVAEIGEVAAKMALAYATGVGIFGEFIDVAYYLDGVSVMTLEGSTTTVPTEIKINHVERDSLIDKTLYAMANECFKDELKDYSFNFGGTFVEILGNDLGVDSTFISGAKSILKIQQGETDYTFNISIDDGKHTENSIYNDYVTITTGTGTQGLIDTLNGTGWTVKFGEVSIQAKAPGSTKIKIGVTDSVGNLEREYTWNVTVEDTTIKETLTLSPGSVENTIQVDENKLKTSLEAKSEKDKDAFLSNPYMYFDSELEFKVEGQTQDSKYSVTVNGEDYKSIVDGSVTTRLTYNGETAEISFDRAAMEKIGETVTADTSVTVSAERLSDEDALLLGSTQPTYRLLVSSGGTTVSDFGEGSVYVSLPYELEDGKNAAIEHIKDDGTVEQISCTYNAETKRVEFSTNGFSCFRIRTYDGEVLTTKPTISGGADKVGAVLTASVSGAADSELSYTWYRGDDFTTAVGTGTSYTLSYADSNQTLTVRVTGTRTGKYDSSCYTEQTYTVAKLAISGTVNIITTGRLKEGSVLSADLSGVLPALSEDDVTYTWSGGSGNASGKTYTVTAEDVKNEAKLTLTIQVKEESDHQGSLTSGEMDVSKQPLTLTAQPAFSDLYAYETANASAQALTQAVQAANATLSATDGEDDAQVSVTWTLTGGEWKAVGGSYTFTGAVSPVESDKYTYGGGDLTLTVTVKPVYGVIEQAMNDVSLVYTATPGAEAFGLHKTVDIRYYADEAHIVPVTPDSAFTTAVAVTWTPDAASLTMTPGAEQIFTIASGLPVWASFSDIDRKVLVTDKLPVDIVFTSPAANTTYGDTFAAPVAEQRAKDNGTDQAGTISYLYTGTGDTVYSGESAPTQVGTYRVTATLVSGSHAGSNTCDFAITPRSITVTADTVSRKYGQANGELSAAITAGSLAYADTFEDLGILLTTDATVLSAPGSYDIENIGSGNRNYSLTFLGADKIVISQADAPVLADQNVTLKVSNSTEQTRTVAGLVPADAGAVHYEAGKESVSGSASVRWSVDDSGVVRFTVTGGAVDESVTLPVTISMDNYKDATVSIVIRLTGKDVPQVTVEDISFTYTGSAADASMISGRAELDGQSVSGSWRFAEGQKLTSVRDSGTKTVVFTPDDTNDIESVEATLTLTILQAAPTGSPSYQTISQSGKTLADAKLSIGTLSPAGSVKWVDADGTELAPDTAVTANAEYRWLFTPDDAVNYAVKSGSAVLYATGGAVSGSYEVTLPTQSEHGTVSVDTKKAQEGDRVTISPTPSAGYQVGTVTVKDENGAQIEIVKNSDGTYSFQMPDGKITVEVTFRVELPFTDVPGGAYYEDAVAWAVEKGITTGVTATTFLPELECTRAQAVTFLWRAVGAPAPKSLEHPFTDVDEKSYYYQAMLWAVENEITLGTSDTTFSPDAVCSRAQIVTLLWRLLKTSAVNTSNPFTDVAPDAYYKAAVLWAVEQGVTNGTGSGTFSPDMACSRAQIVTFLYRAMK